MGGKEPGPTPENWPGEAHKQPQLAIQYYFRARSEERPDERHANVVGVRRQYKGILFFAGLLINEFACTVLVESVLVESVWVKKYTKINIEKMKNGSIFCLKIAKMHAYLVF